MAISDSPYKFAGIATGLVLTFLAGKGLLNYTGDLRSEAENAKTCAIHTEAEMEALMGRYSDLLSHPERHGKVVGDEFWPYDFGGDIRIETVEYSGDGSFYPNPFFIDGDITAQMTRNPDIGAKIVVEHSTDIQRVLVSRGGLVEDVSPFAAVSPAGNEADSVKSIITLDGIRLERGDNILSWHIRQEDGGSAHTGTRRLTYIVDPNHARDYVYGRPGYIVVPGPGESSMDALERERIDALKKIEAMFRE